MADKNTIELIKQLRERTGAGMMDCKHALEANNFDVEKSIDWLREKGIAKAASRANRTAAEGLTKVKCCAGCGKAAIVELNCETDFVSASDKFKNLVDVTLEKIFDSEPQTLEEAKALTEKDFGECSIAVGEKLDFRRYQIVHSVGEEGFGSYIHMGGKISVLVVLKKNDPELADGIAMHIAANNPLYRTLEDVPASDRERERAIAESDPKIADKPQEFRAKIVEKKVDKALSSSCLYLQDYLQNEDVTVGELLKSKGNEVVSFVRYQVGEGIAKSSETAE